MRSARHWPGWIYGVSFTPEKVLYCVRGRIVFHTAGGDIELGPGDKMVLPPHTPHAATVSAEGVRCIEAPRRPGDR